MSTALVRDLRPERLWRPHHPGLPAVIAGAWALAVTAEWTGHGEALHHDGLVEGPLPLWAALAVFVVAWQVMVAAMMLPSTLPMLAIFERVTAAQPRSGAIRAAFLAGYAAVWTAFGSVAFLGDMAVHRAVHGWPWLEQRTGVVTGGALVLAGAFQFSPLKERCLRACRHPSLYLQRHYRRGVAAAFRLGRGHGLFCLGCCWALMLVSFAVGVANLAWMAVLTLVMVVERSLPGGDRASTLIGIALLVAGGAVGAHAVLAGAP